MPPTALARQARDLLGEQQAERRERLRPQDRALGVDVVLGCAPARERHLADHQRVLAQQLHEPLARAPRRLARIFGQGVHVRV